MSRFNRRVFLGRTVAGGFAARAIAGGRLSGGVLGANDDVRLAVVGLGSKIKNGGRGKADIREYRNIPGVRIVAVCDVDSRILGEEMDDFGRRNEKVEAYSDVRKLLENKDIDAISITTPNHWHALLTIWACQAGKDVYVQKPASHNISEGRRMVEAADKYHRIVMCPNGSREPHGFIEALDYVRQGNLGKVRTIRGLNYRSRTSIGKVDRALPVPSEIDYDLWSGPAPIAPVMRRNFHYDWHWMWLYGNGDLGNLGIHNVDGCRMAAGGALPRHVISIGGRFGYDDDGQTPNTQIVYYDYEPAPILLEVRGLPKNKSLQRDTYAAKDSWGRGAMDTYKGISVGKVILCEDGYVVDGTAFDNDGRQIKKFTPTTPKLMDNFIQCVRSRRAGDLMANVLEGHLSAVLMHMGNISHRIGQAAPDREIGERIAGNKEQAAAYERFKTHLSANGVDLDKTPATLGAMLTIDPSTERFVGEFSDKANQFISRQYRRPFVVPEKLE